MIQRRRFLKAATAGVAGGLSLCGELRAEDATKAEAPADLSALVKKNFSGGRG